MNEQFGGVALHEHETLTKRVDRMGEPSRSLLQERSEARLREVRARLERGALNSAVAIEMYLTGVFDGSQMEQQRRKSEDPSSGLIMPR